MTTPKKEISPLPPPRLETPKGGFLLDDEDLNLWEEQESLWLDEAPPKPSTPSQAQPHQEPLQLDEAPFLPSPTQPLAETSENATQEKRQEESIDTLTTLQSSVLTSDAMSSIEASQDAFVLDLPYSHQADIPHLRVLSLSSTEQPLPLSTKPAPESPYDIEDIHPVPTEIPVSAEQKPSKTILTAYDILDPSMISFAPPGPEVLKFHPSRHTAPPPKKTKPSPPPTHQPPPSHPPLPQTKEDTTAPIHQEKEAKEAKEAKEKNTPDREEERWLTAFLHDPAKPPATSWSIDLCLQICEAVQTFHDSEHFHLHLDSEKVKLTQLPKVEEILGLQKKPPEKTDDKKKATDEKDTSPPKATEATLPPETTETASAPKQTRYLAPELQKGEPPSPRSDIFLIAAIFYEMVTQRPFSLPLAFPPHDPRFPAYAWEALQPVLQKALSEDPLDRHETIEEFWKAIEKTRKDPNEPSPSKVQQLRETIQKEMLDYAQKALIGQASFTVLSWIKKDSEKEGALSSNIKPFQQLTLANEIVLTVLKDIFGALIKATSIRVQGRIDKKIAAAKAQQKTWTKRLLKIAGKTLFFLGIFVGFFFGATLKTFFLRQQATTPQKPAVPAVATTLPATPQRKPPALPLTLRLWRNTSNYFWPPQKTKTPQTQKNPAQQPTRKAPKKENEPK